MTWYFFGLDEGSLDALPRTQLLLLCLSLRVTVVGLGRNVEKDQS